MMFERNTPLFLIARMACMCVCIVATSCKPNAGTPEASGDAKEGAPPESKEDVTKLVLDKSHLSSIYPAMWFSPSTGEAVSIEKLGGSPPEPKFEIWIEPRDTEC